MKSKAILFTILIALTGVCITNVNAEEYLSENIETINNVHIIEHPNMGTDVNETNIAFHMGQGIGHESFKEYAIEKEAERVAEVLELFEIIEEKQAKARAVKMANVTEVKDNAMLSYDPFFKSELTPEQFNKILAGTALEGCGESYYKMENTYNVNGIFAISVAFHESGYGKYRANTNNFYGMRSNKGWMAFESPDANIQYFGELMNKKWYAGKSIDNIAKTYCPPTHQHWASAIKSMMKNCWDKI